MRCGPTLLLPLTTVFIGEESPERGAVVTVEAALLPDIAPHLASVASFALHENHGFSLHRWEVSNIETGLKVGAGMELGDAIARAELELRHKTVEDILDTYRDAPATARCER